MPRCDRFWAVVCVNLMAVTMFCGNCIACLRDTLDDRAIQWSSLIVMAKLSAVGKAMPLNPSAQPSAGMYQVCDFEITSCLDGAGKAGSHVSVIRFVADADSAKNTECGQKLTDSQVGKSFLLLLRPEADLAWDTSAGQADPRTPQIHDLKAFAIVHLDSADDLGTEGLANAKFAISSTRAAEAQFNPADAKVQVQTLVNAYDDTEEQQAEQAVMDMGPKALPILRDALAKADDSSKARLEKVISAVAPPPLSVQ
jgi:hypothetical protein